MQCCRGRSVGAVVHDAEYANHNSRRKRAPSTTKDDWRATGRCEVVTFATRVSLTLAAECSIAGAEFRIDPMGATFAPDAGTSRLFYAAASRFARTVKMTGDQAAIMVATGLVVVEQCLSRTIRTRTSKFIACSLNCAPSLTGYERAKHPSKPA